MVAVFGSKVGTEKWTEDVKLGYPAFEPSVASARLLSCLMYRLGYGSDLSSPRNLHVVGLYVFTVALDGYLNLPLI